MSEQEERIDPLIPLRNRFHNLSDELEDSFSSQEEFTNTEIISTAKPRPQRRSKRTRAKKENHSSHNETNNAEGENILSNFSSPDNIPSLSRINVACLKPEKLPILSISIDGRKYHALLDSGASNNLVKLKVINDSRMTYKKKFCCY